jgi:phosphopantetheine adenylyltransferase
MASKTHFDDFIKDPEFDRNYDELVRHAQQYSNQRTWCGLFGSINGQSKFSATDIVDGLICKIMTAPPDKRARHFNDRFAIMAQLKGMIESEIHNLITKKANAPVPVILKANREGDTVEVDPIAAIVDTEDTPDSASMLSEEREQKERLLLELIDFVREPELVRIIEGTIDNKSRAEMAAAAHITVERFDADKKRLGRKLREFASAKKKGWKP